MATSASKPNARSRTFSTSRSEAATTQTVSGILKSAPYSSRIDSNTLEPCIDACVECALACVACAEACLGEANVDQLRKCIGLNQACADICGTTARVVSRQHDADTESVKAQLTACVRICVACGTECQRHASHHEHCGVCAEVCYRCEERCEEALAAL